MRVQLPLSTGSPLLEVCTEIFEHLNLISGGGPRHVVNKDEQKFRNPPGRDSF